VIDNQDPDGRLRVLVQKVRPDDAERSGDGVWATVAMPSAGPDHGFVFTPQVGDTVLVGFEGGDQDSPVVLGSIWADTATPPGGVDDVQSIRTPAGLAVVFDDGSDSLSLTLQTPGGATLALNDGAGAITINDAHGNTIVLDGGGVTIASTGSVDISAPMVTVDAALTTFSGTINADAVIANSVVSATYSPGAGNLM